MNLPAEETTMSLYPDSKFQFLQLESIPPGIFGETYVITVGIHTSGDYFKGESYVLTKRPEPRLHQERWRFSSTDVPPELLTVDIDFMLNEGRLFAENHLVDCLYQKAEQTKNAELLGVRVNLIECKNRPLVGCWIRNVFHDQIVEIKNTTECEGLSKYLSLLVSLKTFGSA